MIAPKALCNMESNSSMAETLPLVGIVTSSYNQGRYLRACIDSVLSQDYPNIEYFVMDGGSTDDSVRILESYHDRFYWQSASDDGQTTAVNAGLKRSNAEIVTYLNSDDRLLPGAVRQVVEAFASNPKIDVIYGQGLVIDEGGNYLHDYDTHPFDFLHFQDVCFICQPAAFWRRALHERHGYFDPRFDNTLDYEFWLRLATRSVKFLYLPEPLAESRSHPEAKSRMRRPRIFKEIRDLQMLHLGYCSKSWWEQYLRHMRDETSGLWSRLLPGREGEPLNGLAKWLHRLYRKPIKRPPGQR